MVEKSLRSQFRDIEKEVKNIANEIAKETSKDHITPLNLTNPYLVTNLLK